MWGLLEYPRVSSERCSSVHSYLHVGSKSSRTISANYIGLVFQTDFWSWVTLWYSYYKYRARFCPAQTDLMIERDVILNWGAHTNKPVFPHARVLIVNPCFYCGGAVHLYVFMMTSLNGNIYRVPGPVCGEFTGHRWIPLTKASDAEL